MNGDKQIQGLRKINDARDGGDAVALQAMRIAAAVPVFVHAVNGGGCLLRESQLPRNASPSLAFQRKQFGRLVFPLH